MAQPDCPLTDEHCQMLTQAQESCVRCRENIAKAKRLGIDVAAIEAENESNMEYFTTAKRTYFPHRP